MNRSSKLIIAVAFLCTAMLTVFPSCQSREEEDLMRPERSSVQGAMCVKQVKGFLNLQDNEIFNI